MSGGGGAQQPARGPGSEVREDQGAEQRRPGLQACPAEGFTVLQQCPTAGSPSSGQKKGVGAQGWRQVLSEGEREWNVEPQVLMPTQVS